MKHLPIRTPAGGLLQAGIPKRMASFDPVRANGLLLRGVVVATYEIDNDTHRQNDGRAPNGAVAVYCDVLAYGSNSGMRHRLIPQCLVSQSRGGLHNDSVWKPKATTKDITGTLDRDKGSSWAYWDGDHVLVGFIDDDLGQPIILRGIPHPSADSGAKNNDERQTLQLKVVDGDPDFCKHHGTHYGVEDNGDWVVDSRFANDGVVEDNGDEAPPATSGQVGSQHHRLPLVGTFDVVLHDMGEQPSKVKATIAITKNGLTVQYDSGILLTIDNTNDRMKVTTAGGTEFLVDGQSGLIEMGAEGAGDKAVLNSKMVDDMDELRDRVSTLSDQIEKMQYPLPLQMMPLIPNPGAPYLAVTKNGYLVDPVTGSPPAVGTGPKKVEASLPEYNPLLLEDGGSTGDLASTRVTIDQ